jgi:hypothetical protein
LWSIQKKSQVRHVAAHDQESAGVGGDVGAAVLCVREIQSPHGAFVLARFHIRFGEQRCLADRCFIHHRRDVARDLLVDPNRAPLVASISRVPVVDRSS